MFCIHKSNLFYICLFIFKYSLFLLFVVKFKSGLGLPEFLICIFCFKLKELKLIFRYSTVIWQEFTYFYKIILLHNNIIIPSQSAHATQNKPGTWWKPKCRTKQTACRTAKLCAISYVKSTVCPFTKFSKTYRRSASSWQIRRLCDFPISDCLFSWFFEAVTLTVATLHYCVSLTVR